MSHGLTAKQEIVEVTVHSFMRDSLKAALEAELMTRREHRIVALTTAAGGDEFNGVLRATAVIEYL
ncbi:hypothetical protein [Microbacterium sp.]|uniref:hypothetical protein n=1 Tax=Microbacterium sp. TaxID=51671 RepID=UPI0025E26FE0|nr:hypothetical protein [Microbacterium sp.]